MPGDGPPGGPSNRELLQKLARLGTQLEIIDERLKVLEKHALPGGGSGKGSGTGGKTGTGGSSAGGDGASSLRNGGSETETLVQSLDGPGTE